MNDKTIKDRQRKSVEPSRCVGTNRADVAHWKPIVDGHKRNLTISENFVRPKMGKSSSRHHMGGLPQPMGQSEAQNTRKSNQKAETETRHSGLRPYLSEKYLKLKTPDLAEAKQSENVLRQDKLSPNLLTGHFLHSNYKVDISKADARTGSRSHWLRSNLSLQKKEASLNPPKNPKNNSLIIAAIAKSRQTGKLKGLLLDDTAQHFIETRNKPFHKKTGTNDAILIPAGLNIPTSPIKNKALFLNQNIISQIAGNRMKGPTDRETQEKNLRKEVPWEAPSPASVVQVCKNSAKNGDSKEASRKDQNYFFNLKSLQKIRLKDKPTAISHKSGLPTNLSNNQSTGEIKVAPEPSRTAHNGFLKKALSGNSIKKDIDKRSKSRLHPDIAESFPEMLSERLPNPQAAREPAIPKFQEIFQNICNEKESEDLKTLKDLVKTKRTHDKVPETDTSFYEIIKRIGEGSFGKVFLGLQKLTNRLVAIKRLDKANCKDEGTRKKILSEVNIQKLMFGHPNIIKLLEVFENPQYVYFVMEYAANGDLLKHLKQQRRLEEDEARGIFFQVASGLRYIHHNGIIHRDIKLDNILIDEHSHSKICDFGVGRFMKPGELINEQCGTPAYLAPEIVLEKGYQGFGADVWSLGVLLFCLLTGNMPFKAATLEKLNELIVKGDIVFPEDVELSAEVRELITAMLCVDPDRRPTIQGVLDHPWVKAVNMNRATFQTITKFERDHFKILSDTEYQINEAALSFVADIGFDREAVRRHVLQKQMNHATACYFTIERDFI